MLRIDIVKRLFTFVLSTGAVLFLVFITQPSTPSNEQQRSTSAEITSVQSNQTSGIISVAQDNTSSSDPVDAKTTTALTGKEITYQVKMGDTLSEIALKYGISVDLLKGANGLAKDNIAIDQKLVVPLSANSTISRSASITKTASEKKKTITPPSPSPSRSKVATAGRVGELIHWSQSQKIFSIGETAALIDVNTGETFNIKRKGGHNHADCEPLTAADTSIMKSLYKTWSWNRRAVVLVVDGQKIAASMAGMPHGSETIAGNSFSGHFDLHFLGSMTHGSSYTKTGIPQVDPDHQAMVRKAAGR